MPTTPKLLLPLLCALTLLAPAAAYAAWPHDPNVNVSVGSPGVDRSEPTMIPDGAGGAFVAWTQGSENVDVFMQRLDGNGQQLWGPNGVVVSAAAGHQYSPVIAADGVGGVLVVWSDERNGNEDLYAQRLNASGVVQWLANGVPVAVVVDRQFEPTIVSDGAGGAIIAWEDARAGGDDIYAQRIAANGTAQWALNGVGVAIAFGGQFWPRAVSDGAGGLIVTWQDGRVLGAHDIYAQRMSPSGTPLWAVNGTAVCDAAEMQQVPDITSDGAGGALIAWTDTRNPGANIYAQRMSAAGAPMWTTNGVAVCTAYNLQDEVVVSGDGSGGLLVAWRDYRSDDFDLYVQRLTAAGLPLWSGDGVPICTAPGMQTHATVVSDGSGGAIVSWADYRAGISGSDIYSQRVSATGTVMWTLQGVPVTTAVYDQYYTVSIPDGRGGAIVAWQDLRTLPRFGAYAQRIERFGVLGDPEPVIAYARDVPNDQGGQVKVAWYASWLDADPTYRIASYSLWRSAPPFAAMKAIREGARLIAPDDPDPLPSPGVRVFTTSMTGDATQTIFWELVTSQIASGDAGYSLIAPTTGDSIAGSNPRTLFRVQARDVNGVAFWNSAPDSGYSVDNLPPVAPAPFFGSYSGGTAMLGWGANAEPDLAHYVLHRGSSASFVPGPANLVASPTGTEYVDAAGAPYYYKLAAYDSHGNRSPFTLLLPVGTTGVGDEVLPRVLALSPALPNPARGGTSFRIALPREGDVGLAIFDQQGRRIRELLRGPMPAGEHVLRWDGLDGSGQPAPSGLYFCRLDAESRTVARRFAVVR